MNVCIHVSVSTDNVEIYRVCYLAGELVEKMQQYVEQITKADILCVKIAGLCYNLGKNQCSWRPGAI